MFEQALKLHQSGHVKEAEQLYKKLLRENPKDADVLHLWGILLAQQGCFKEALEPLRTALTIKPSSSLHNNLGNVEKHLGNIEQAIYHYQEALKLPSASSAIHNNLGTLYHLKKQWDKAIICYQKAIEIRLDYADAYYNLAHVFIQTGRYSEAITQLDFALQHQPQHEQAHFQLGQLLLQQQRPEEAIKHYKSCLEIDPDHIEAHHQLAVSLTQQNQLEAAIAHYQKTLELKPDHGEALHNLGALYVVQRKPECALPCYLKLLETRADFDAYYNIGVIYQYQNRYDDAIIYLKEALKLHDSTSSEMGIEANACNRPISKLDVLFERNAAIEQEITFRKRSNAYINLGAVYLKKEEWEKAAFYYKEALALKPQDPELLYILAALTESPAPQTTPRAYIENLFNQYAPYFDKHLVTCLDYHVPELLLQTVKKQSGESLKIDVLLDLGCGTGLCGEAFRPYAEKMIGVDLSDSMLSEARKKNIYDVLENADIEDALQKYSSLDAVIAGDVFGYVGDLEKTFLLVAKALKKSACFSFTTEQTWEADFKLQQNARFAHHRHYIERLAQKYEFNLLSCENVVLRQQKGQPVEGMVWVFRSFPIHV